ncbi:uncharacterized protein TNCV_873621 [Trichonephila clavipes]|nr:uncharacterized protein TNCV_873621 [Trichonephila clavipes]
MCELPRRMSLMSPHLSLSPTCRRLSVMLCRKETSTTQGLLATDLITLNHGLVTRTTPSHETTNLSKLPHHANGRTASSKDLTYISPIYTADLQWHNGSKPRHSDRRFAPALRPFKVEGPGLAFRRVWVAAVAEWSRYRIVACLVASSSPLPLKTRRVGQRCTLNLSRAETSSRWCGVVVRRESCQLRCSPRHLTMVQNYVVRRQKPSCS